MSPASHAVSVVLPVFNGEAYLPEALESIRGQTRQPLEILVVDDGSTDRSAEVAAAFAGVRLVRQKNGGPAAARNAGLREVRGDIVAFLDADDLWPSDKLAVQLTEFQRNPNADVVMGQVQFLRLTDAATRTFTPFSPPRFSVNLGSGLFRKSAFERVGVYDPEMRHSEDVDWFLRARERGLSIATHDQVSLFYRIHENNMTRHKHERDAFFVKALKRSLDRRRAATE